MRTGSKDVVARMLVLSILWSVRVHADAEPKESAPPTDTTPKEGSASAKESSPSADAATGGGATSPPFTEVPPRAPWPYALPFQLRSVIPKTGVRIDTTVAPYRVEDAHALVAVVLFSGQLRLSDNFALQLRWGFDDNRVGNGTKNRTGIVNPTIGALVSVPMGPFFRFAASTAIGIPIATGGGDGSDTSGVLLQKQGALARSAMDNTTFSVNDMGVPTGISLAFIAAGFTTQVDWTIIASARVRGPSGGDSAKVNSTTGIFLGYFIVPEVSVGAELRYQYYLVPPESLPASSRDNLTAGFGARLDVEISDASRMRPGVCYSTGLAGPISDQSYSMVQFDIPISF